jgi:hypothetical protein
LFYSAGKQDGLSIKYIRHAGRQFSNELIIHFIDYKPLKLLIPPIAFDLSCLLWYKLRA